MSVINWKNEQFLSNFSLSFHGPIGCVWSISFTTLFALPGLRAAGLTRHQSILGPYLVVPLIPKAPFFGGRNRGSVRFQHLADARWLWVVSSAVDDNARLLFTQLVGRDRRSCPLSFLGDQGPQHLADAGRLQVAVPAVVSRLLCTWWKPCEGTKGSNS